MSGIAVALLGRFGFGSWDFEIGVEVLHPRDLVALKEALYEKFTSQISSLRVLSRFKVHKYILYPIVNENGKVKR